MFAKICQYILRDGWVRGAYTGLKCLWEWLDVEHGDLDPFLEKTLHNDFTDTAAAAGHNSDLARPDPAVGITAHAPAIGCKGVQPGVEMTDQTNGNQALEDGEDARESDLRGKFGKLAQNWLLDVGRGAGEEQ